MIVIVLVNVAFITLFERKVLRFSQNRLGPNKVSFLGLLQPMRDAVKLFLKKETKPFRALVFLFYLAPFLSLYLIFMVWQAYRSRFINFFIKYNYLYLLIVISLGVYPILYAGWFSNRNYSFIGGLRAVAQTISYEVCIAFFILVFIFYNARPSLYVTGKLRSGGLFLRAPVFLLIWLLIILAETNRTPFDFAEGESELVSGFNTEYRGAGFALLFIAEYGIIFFISHLTTNIFCYNFGELSKRGLTLMFIFFWIWTRASLPRHRYDLLIRLAWKSLLPLILGFIVFTVSLIF